MSKPAENLHQFYTKRWYKDVEQQRFVTTLQSEKFGKLPKIQQINGYKGKLLDDKNTFHMPRQDKKRNLILVAAQWFFVI